MLGTRTAIGSRSPRRSSSTLTSPRRSPPAGAEYAGRGVAVTPQAQARRRLHLPRGKVDASVAQGLFQRGLGLEAAPAERDAQR